jgi:hypothetical protein
MLTRLFDQPPGEQVGEAVEDADDEEQRPDRRGGEADDVGVVEQ